MKKGLLVISLIILILSFSKVKAASYGNGYMDHMKLKFNGSESDMVYTGDGLYTRSIAINSSSGLESSLWIDFDTLTLPSNAKSLNLTLKFKNNSTQTNDITLYDNQYSCDISTTEYSWYLGPNSSSGTSMYDHEYKPTSFTCNGRYVMGSETINEYRFGINVAYTYGNNDWLYTPCYAQGQAGYDLTFVCPIMTNNIDGFKIGISTNQEMLVSLGLYPVLTYDIDNVQTIIEKQQEQTEILNQNATYSDDSDKFTNETQQVNDYTQKEENLFNNLEFDVNGTGQITINPNASAFIWDIVNGLRTINPAIILLMTSILGIGIIKLVLNR